MTPDPESAARRAMEMVGGPLVLTPKLTARDCPLSWTVSYTRRLCLPGDTVEIDDEVSAYGLLACLEALEKRLVEQDAALLRHLTERQPREEKADEPNEHQLDGPVREPAQVPPQE